MSERCRPAARAGKEASGVPLAPRSVARLLFAAHTCKKRPSHEDVGCERTPRIAEAKEVSRCSRDVARAGRKACGEPMTPCNDARFSAALIPGEDRRSIRDKSLASSAAMPRIGFEVPTHSTRIWRELFTYMFSGRGLQFHFSFSLP